MALIEIKSVRVMRERNQVIADLSVEIQAGTITAVIGANGSGKSTLIGAIAGDYPLDFGQIFIGGRNLSELSLAEQSRLRSVVTQNQFFWLAFTVRQIIEMGQSGENLSRVDSVLSQLGISEIIDQSVLTLSVGQLQRVAIARALVCDTPIYLFDEPLASQDKRSRTELISLFCKMRDEGKTIVLVMHSEKSELDWCDQVIEDLS
jgi:ABC-type cobalamin/Fe3+-siderophores transport system ATPase subunit